MIVHWFEPHEMPRAESVDYFAITMVLDIAFRKIQQPITVMVVHKSRLKFDFKALSTHVGDFSIKRFFHLDIFLR